MALPCWNPMGLVLALLSLAAVCHCADLQEYQCYSFGGSRLGAIKPQGNIVIEVGSSYEAYCLVNPEFLHAKDVYFERTGSEAGRITHTVVNESAIKVEVTHTRPTSYDLRCLAEDGDFICQRSVFVGYKPKDVENFKCLSNNFENLNCTWKAPENPVKVAYNLKYTIPYFLHERNCPQRGENWCFWNRARFHSSHQLWAIILEAKNDLVQEPARYIYKIDIYASVIPKAPVDFDAVVSDSRKVQLSWKLPHPIDVFSDGNVTHEVQYRLLPFRNMYEDSPWELVDIWEESPPRFERKIYTKDVENLQPYVEYEFSVRLHTGTGPVRDEMWSKPALLTKRTHATIPGTAPQTTLGMFEVEETKMHRDMYISWQTVEPLLENGPDFEYQVTIFDERYESPLFPPRTTENSFAKFLRLDNNVAYRFVIKPQNREGLAEDSIKSEVLVPRKSALLRLASYFKVIAYTGENTTTYNVRWRLPVLQHASHDIKTVTLFWCKQTEYENRCQNKIEWEIINEPEINSKNLTGYDTSSRYMFGISINSHNSSSGIKWSTCIARHGIKPPALPLLTVANVSSTGVTLKWALDCKTEAVQPHSFNISYCIGYTNCSEQEKYVIVEGESAVEHRLEDLSPYTNYLFSIATISDLGLGIPTPSISVKTKPSEPNGPPQNIRVIGKSPTAIAIAWDPPLESERNGEIIKYIIRNKTGEFLSPSQRERNALTFNFTELEPFTEYYFEVLPCTKINSRSACGSTAAAITEKTMIGAPGKIESFHYDGSWLQWDHDECNGPSCYYVINYTINGTNVSYTTPQGYTAVASEDLNISCPVDQKDILVSIKAISSDEENRALSGPSMQTKIPCPGAGLLAWWIILTIAAVCIILTLILLLLVTYGREQIKIFWANWKRKPELPSGLVDSIKPSYMPVKENNSPSILTFKPSDKEELIKPVGDRQHRNISGDSGASMSNSVDSSGCSTGGDSVSSSGSDRIPPSSDSGTVQEENAFLSKGNNHSGSVRLRPAPSYVCQGLPEKLPYNKGYVALGSVPNLSGTMMDGMLPLQQSHPIPGREPLTEMRMGGRRTSTGYISMPTNDNDGMNFPLDDFGNLVFPHERRPGDYLAYSRHYMPYRKTSTLSPYTKAHSLPWLNTGYVAVAQVEDGGHTAQGAQGYVAVGDAMNVMKRQPSLPSLTMDISKTLFTPDEDLPPGAYCKLGARESPDPPSNSNGYVSETQSMPVSSSSTPSSQTHNSPYVTCAMAESVASPKNEPPKAATDYVSLGDMTDGQWAHPIMHPTTPEEPREIVSAPVEGTRSRIVQPVRPNSSETNNNSRSRQFGPTGHSLSKQSSGYASGNASQETLTFNDPLVMSPKKLLARRHEPHPVVYSPYHKPSMV